MADLNKELDRIEEGEAWDESDEVVQITAKRPLDKVVPVRLPSETWEQLRQEARELGVGPTTLARIWILERLRFQSRLQEDQYISFPFGSTGLNTSVIPIRILKEAIMSKYPDENYIFEEFLEMLSITQPELKKRIDEILQESKLNEVVPSTKTKEKT